jgi:hypothetical protein
VFFSSVQLLQNLLVEGDNLVLIDCLLVHVVDYIDDFEEGVQLGGSQPLATVYQRGSQQFLLL